MFWCGCLAISQTKELRHHLSPHLHPFLLHLSVMFFLLLFLIGRSRGGILCLRGSLAGGGVDLGEL